MTFAITNGKIFDGETLWPSHALIVKGESVVDLVAASAVPDNLDTIVDLDGDILAPGFVDLQVNGGGGIMFNSAPSLETIKAMAVAHRSYGTTGLLPTLITDSYEVMEKAVAAVEQAMNENVPGVLGIHLEGPFLSEGKKGAHDANKFCQIDAQGFAIVTSLKKGKTIATLAPELTDGKTIGALTDAGVIVCAGHSSATYEQAVDAIQAGVTGFTHLYNAMTPLQSRTPGMVGAALCDESTWFGIIADGFHMHPAAFKVAVKAKQEGGAILVTDAMSTVGAASNSFELNGETIHAVNGRCENAAGALAGSDLDMNTAVKNAVKFADIEWQEAVRMASLYPAKALGLDHKLGRLKPGYLASMVRLSSTLDVKSTWVNGIPFDAVK